MADVRERVKKQEPELDVEFTQVLQDMIGDLSNSPEPIQIKLFSSDVNMLHDLGPRVADALAKIPGVVDVENGIDNTVSGPATEFQVDPVVAGRMGFTPTEVAENATLDPRWPAHKRSDDREWPSLYNPRLRLPDANRASLDAIQKHGLQFELGPHGDTRRNGSGDATALRRMRFVAKNLQQVVLVSGRP